MRGPRAPRTAVTALVALLAAAATSTAASAETFALTRPAAATCVTDGNAVYSVQDGALHPVQGEFMIFPPGTAAFRPLVSEASGGNPGQLLRMYAWSDEPLDSLTAEIGVVQPDRPGKPILRTRGFRCGSLLGSQVWMVLVGIPPWEAPGQYTLTLSAAAATRSYLRLQPFTVSARPFSFERIPLSGSLTELVTVPDEQKTRESQILARVLSTAHADAVYESGPLTVPFLGARRTSGYGDRREYDYSDGTKGSSIHLGVDIASPEGTPVPASGRGRVVFAAFRLLTGNTVIIEHLPGLFTVYYHLSALRAAVGEVVERGQVIGLVGMTGFATGPHLHWEVENLGSPVDPDAAAAAPLLDKRRDFFDIIGAASTEGR